MKVVFSFINYYGIGDNVRGLISLLQIQKKLQPLKDVSVHVNLSNSHIGNYVLHKLDDELSELVKSKDINYFLYSNENLHDDQIIQYILNSQDEVIHINTNNFPDINNISQDIKDFVKNIFKFTPEFENVFNSYLEKAGSDFDIFHYRFGDDIFNNDSVNTGKIVDSIQQINSTNNCIVLSDSLNLKKELYDMYNNNKIIVFLEKPTHTNNTSGEDAIYIFIDFFLASRAKNIYCWCVYGRLSNFVLWHSYIYDIPLTKIEVR
jgi:hypothetical protein